MAQFSYQATKDDGSKITGQVEATDRASAIKLIVKQRLKPFLVEEIRGKPSLAFISSKKVKSDHIVIFTRELSAMVSAGVPLLRAITSLQAHTDSQALRTVLESVIRDVEAGTTLGDAFNKFPETFSSVYVNMVRAGEAAGILDEILKRLALQQEKNAAIRKKIKSAMTYPMVLVAITVLAFFGLMLFVIPQIGKIIKDLGGPNAELPALTTFMLGISGFLIQFWYIIIPVFVGGIILLLRWLRTPDGKKILHTLVLKIPGVKNIIMKVAVARFARTFSALIGAGVAVLEALDVTAHSLGNVVYEKALLDAIPEVQNGAMLSSVLEKNSLFPAIVPQMLSVGEETGQTDTVLVKVADFYEEEVDVAIEGLSSIIEPVMIVFMGSMVGLIAASVMLPIANLSQSIKE
jgi:type IV pilus assembly protein PilC